MNLASVRLQLAKRPQLTANACIFAALAPYLLGLEWPLLITLLIVFTVLLPMPKIFGSWLSRSVVALLLVYSMIQIAALLQFAADPGGRFIMIAVILTVLAMAVVAVFGREGKQKLPAVSLKDLYILVPVVLFVLPFSQVLSGHDRLGKIAAIAGVQVTDSMAHYNDINNFFMTQNLNYKIGQYYPSGFHIATAFIEKGLFGDVPDAAWQTHITVYMAQYFIMGVLLLYVLTYFGYAVLQAFGHDVHKDGTAFFTLAVAIGGCAVLTYLLVFTELGFLNYFYVCAALLAAGIFLLDRGREYDRQRSLSQNLSEYSWPLTAFLLLGFSAGFSWTLLTPVVLLCGLIAVVPTDMATVLRTDLRRYFVANLTIVAVAACNLAGLYVQYKYTADNRHELSATGALSSFNLPFIIIGMLVTMYAVTHIAPLFGRRLATFIFPFVVIVSLLLFAQLFILGEARYYAIKIAYFLDMFSLIMLSATVVHWLSSAGMPKVLRFLWGTAAVCFVVLATIALTPKPFQEARSLLRGASQLGKPPYLDSDAKSIAFLGANNRIADFNLTVLHYDADGSRLSAQIETALWANFMSPSNSGSVSAICFNKQFSLLAYGTGSPSEQRELVQAVKDCISASWAANRPYYIVTDSGSVMKLQQVFGNKPVLLTQ